MNHWDKLEHEKYFYKERKSEIYFSYRFFDGNENSEYRIIEDTIIYEIYTKKINVEGLKSLFKTYSELDLKIRERYIDNSQHILLEDIKEPVSYILHCEMMKRLLSFYIIKLEELQNDK